MNCAIHTETPAAAFCRTCGKALCENCKRDVMGAIYCEPCIAARLQGGVPSVTAVPITVVQGTPSPGLAALLGIIPGVGAMYNGQFIKALVHVLIFVLLIMAAKHISLLFLLLIFFFVFYMMFEAHETAKARQLGQPSPDPLGIEQLFGIPENQRTAVGAVHPKPPEQTSSTTKAATAPTGAIVLIVLGILFLLGNLRLFEFDRLWPIFLIALGVWIAYKRTTGRG